MDSSESAGLRRIGLTGGIGAGKSTVGALWREAGMRVIDLDALSRRVLDEPGPGVEETIAAFGEQFRTAHGVIDRAALARLVFADATARERLERIVLSRVDDGVRRLEEEARNEGLSTIVHDSPLLLEKRQEERYAAVIAVLAPREDRIARVLRDRGRDRAYTESVMAAQVSDLERIRRADRLVLNGAGRAELRERAGCALDAVTGSASAGVDR